jgi:hypothetical protein
MDLPQKEQRRVCVAGFAVALIKLIGVGSLLTRLESVGGKVKRAGDEELNSDAKKVIQNWILPLALRRGRIQRG